MHRRTFLTAAAALPLAGCAPPTLVAPPGVTLTHVKTWSPLEAWALLKLTSVEGVRPSHTVDAWRVLYPSKDSAGRPITLSGLIALPRDAKPDSLVVWLHGTTTTRTAVPSNVSTDGMAAAFVFAGTGRAVIAPDYLGLGASPLTHTYLVADDTARAVTDLLASARKVAGVPATPPFMIGFSQGAHASLATQARLEAAGQAVRGSAAVAGAHNLRTISLGEALAGGAASHSLYLAYMVRGYAARYGHPMASVLTEAAAARATDLFDRPHKPEEIMAGLPKAPREMFRPDFLAAFDAGQPHWMLDALAANETSHFTPRAPIRLYYGRADRDVVPREAITTAAEMTRRGGNVRAIDVGPVGHDPSLLAAAPDALAWLAELGG
jgi:acetyl esterase/lipase